MSTRKPKPKKDVAATVAYRDNYGMYIQSGSSSKDLTDNLLRILAVPKSDEVIIGALGAFTVAFKQPTSTNIEGCTIYGLDQRQ